MTSWVVVVVRINVNSGISGAEVLMGSLFVSLSSVILSFFFKRSFSGIVEEELESGFGGGRVSYV
jgi:hypothetical protein